MELSGISKYQGANLGGLKTIQYAPIHWINTSILIDLVTDANNFLYSIPFSTGSWLSLPTLPIDDDWNERSRRPANGPVYPQNISAVVPNLRPAVTLELEKMVNMRFILRITDKNGQEWLIGEPRVGLSFDYSASGGSTRGFNNYEISFSGSMSRPAAQYDPQFTPS